MNVLIGTAEPRSTFFVQGEALARLLAQDLPGAAVVAAPGASIGNARDLGAGKLALGFMAANWVGRAGRGEPPFEAPIDLRIVAPMNSGPMFFVTRADRPIEGLRGLKGKRVAVGPETSGMHQHTRGILPAVGLDFDMFEPVHLDFAEGARALVDGAVDAQFQAPIPNPIMDELARTTAVRAIRPDPEEITAVVEAIPHYRRAVLRAGAFAGHEADSEQIAVLNVLVTHARVPDATIAAVVNALLERTDRLMEEESLFRGLAGLLGEIRAEGLSALERHGVPVHPGAVQAYRARGVSS